MKRCSLILSMLFLCLSAKAYSAEYKDIAYGTIDRQKLDIYTPDNDLKNAPVIVHVHGGGWRIGNKRLVQDKPKAFNDKGYVFVSVGYPLLPDHPVETQAQSVANAVAWVHKNIAQYGGNPDSIVLTGHSAGAHLITLITTDQNYLSKAETDPRIIKHIISIDGAGFDIPWRMKTFTREGQKGERIYTNAFGKDDPKRWKKLSPVYYVSDDKYIPATLFLTAAARGVSNEAAADFSQKLNAIGVTSKVAPIENRTHGSINKLMGTEGDAAFAALLDFIE